MCPHLIFDLDGTISDPAIGIARSINYALSSFGYPALPEKSISHYIGPPVAARVRAGGDGTTRTPERHFTLP
jgi:phosphoglycolate phosphatase